MFDVVIIGGGVVGCCIARALSRYLIRVAVIEKAADIGEGASKANSGIVHAGYDAAAGTLKALLNVRGNSMMKELAEELDFPYRNNGSLVLAFREEDQAALNMLLERGQSNGVSGLRLLTGAEAIELEPNLSPQVKYALAAPTGGIVCPFGLTVAMAENAAANGVEFFRDTRVTAITGSGIAAKDHSPADKNFRITARTSEREMYFESRVIINAAGIYADDIHNMVSPERMTLIPRRGEYLLFDKNTGNMVTHTLFQLPGTYGKGVLVTPTVHGNILMGPTAEVISDKEGVDTTASGLNTVLEKAAESVAGIPRQMIITSFAGLRAGHESGDFIIKEAAGSPGFIDVAGIDSPGLTSAPAIGEFVAERVGKIIPLEEKMDFNPNRIGIHPGKGEIVCRCETVTKEEILEAIHRVPGAVSLDGVKRRTRAGMGRCQSGFCSPRIVDILARELGREKWEITKSGPGSEVLAKTISVEE